MSWPRNDNSRLSSSCEHNATCKHMYNWRLYWDSITWTTFMLMNYIHIHKSFIKMMTKRIKLTRYTIKSISIYIRKSCNLSNIAIITDLQLPWISFSAISRVCKFNISEKKHTVCISLDALFTKQWGIFYCWKTTNNTVMCSKHSWKQHNITT